MKTKQTKHKQINVVKKTSKVCELLYHLSKLYTPNYYGYIPQGFPDIIMFVPANYDDEEHVPTICLLFSQSYVSVVSGTDLTEEEKNKKFQYKDYGKRAGNKSLDDDISNFVTKYFNSFQITYSRKTQL